MRCDPSLKLIACRGPPTLNARFRNDLVRSSRQAVAVDRVAWHNLNPWRPSLNGQPSLSWLGQYGMTEVRFPYGNPDIGVTRLLSAWRSGDARALDRLTPLVYEELRELAHRYMRRERSNHTLQATAVVHEAFVRLVGMEVSWQDRGHFYAVAARLMRRILVDHAKARHRVKRGGPVTIVSVDVYQDDNELNTPATSGEIDVLEIDEALERLAQQDERLANAVELHYFGGLTYQETAKALGVSEATVHRDLRLAKAWILKQIRVAPTDSPGSNDR
jgi:RNA polymerase sigma factor (TIGR02999 family)